MDTVGKYGVASGKMQNKAATSGSSWTVPHGLSADIARGSGTLLDVVSYLRDPTSKAYKRAGKYAKQSADFENAQLEARGKEDFAIGQRAALAEQDTATQAISRAVAVAAASGGSATDPTVLKIIGDLASEGNTNALSALYEGESSQVAYENEIMANKFNAKADVAGYRFQGKAYKRANYDKAFGALLSGVTPFLEKYG